MPHLILPTTRYKTSYNRYIEELKDEERYPYPMDLDHVDFDAFVRRLSNYSLGKALPEWMVPNTTYWLMENDEVIGCSHLRHELNESLEFAGGHIGIGIRPSFRGKGLGKLLLELTLNKAREKHIEQVHIHCYQSNIASKKLLESVGAIFDSKEQAEDSNEIVLRYLYHNN